MCVTQWKVATRSAMLHARNPQAMHRDVGCAQLCDHVAQAKIIARYKHQQAQALTPSKALSGSVDATHDARTTLSVARDCVS